MNGIQEVSGSIPLISTKKVLKSYDFRTFSFLYTLFVRLSLLDDRGSGELPLTKDRDHEKGVKTGYLEMPLDYYWIKEKIEICLIYPDILVYDNGADARSTLCGCEVPR